MRAAHGLTSDDLRHMMAAVADRLIDSEEILCAADRAIGDGDHGIGMRRGFKAVVEMLPELEVNDPAGVLVAVGRTMLGEMGGASGVMFGLMFMGRPGKASETAELSVAEFARRMKSSLETVMARGGAQQGDKTMVDALIPAVEALEEQARRNADWGAALRAAAAAAARGAEETRIFPARFGKARTLGDRALGHPDPGALSVSFIFDAMARWADQRTQINLAHMAGEGAQ